MDHASNPEGPKRAVGLIAVLAAGTVAVGAFLIALVVWTMRCDEGCLDEPNHIFRPGEHWTKYHGSWQWTAQFAAAAVGILAVALAVAFAARGQAKVARVTAIVALSGYATWAAFFVI